MDQEPRDKKYQLWRWSIYLGVGISILFIPIPGDISPEGWHVFAVFCATIAGFLTRPLGMGPVVLISIVLLGVGEGIRYRILGFEKSQWLLSFARLQEGFSDGTVWLVVAAFLLAGVVIETGLGRRISFFLIKKWGRTLRGLSYAVCGSELILAPFIPSNTARGGGLMAPIVNALAHTLGSTPSHQPEKAGKFLVLTGAHSNLITSSMFLTAMAANPIAARLGSDIMGVEFSWGIWLMGSIVPGLLGLLLLPIILERLVQPTLVSTQEARKLAHEELSQLGPVNRNQRILAGVMLALLVLWATSFIHGLDAVLIAWLGLVVLLIGGVTDWKSYCQNAGAWDALIWLGGMITMANLLREEGVVSWFAQVVSTQMETLDHWPALGILILLAIIYFYSMYGFSMLTGHIMAFIAAFITIASELQMPPLITIALFAYFSTLCACLTNYSSGPVIIYFGLEYVEIGRWFKVGFIVSLFHMLIWLGAGLFWWKILGWW